MAQPGFHIRTSYRLDDLVDDLAALLGEHPLPPMRPEVMLVQSQGMRRWLQLGLADRLGCAANLDMPFPGSYFRRMAESVDAGMPAGGGKETPSPFGPEAMTWRIDRLLDDMARRPAFSQIRAYLEDGAPRKRYQLCSRIAEAFDRYQVYRPEVLRQWRTGDGKIARHDLWQAELWRALCAEADGGALSKRLVQLIELLRRGTHEVELPDRLTVFGMTSLAPIFIELLKVLARHIPVRVYVVVADQTSVEDPHGQAAPRHPLSESMGAQCREFLSLLRVGEVHQAHLGHAPSARSAEPATLLQSLQAQILGGPADRTSKPSKLIVAPGDRSLQVHICHSPIREMEVLHDCLLEAFQADPSLRPWDVAVMMPDVAGYAPYINAVFGAERADVPPIPYRIADRPRHAEESVVNATMGILDLVDRRLGVNEVIDLLELDAVREAAGLTAAELSTVQDWFSRTAVHWGMDAGHRAARFDVPPDPKGTWRWALERLLMGYAVGPLELPVDNVLPTAGALGGSSELLGRTVDWLERLFHWIDVLSTPATLADWSERLGALAADLLAGEGGSEEDVEGIVQQQAVALGQLSESADHRRKTPLGMIREHLAAVFGSATLPRNFIGGGVTFCGLKPMRTIPFKVVALCGMEAQAFPRRQVYPDFDLMGRDAYPGDRNRRQDDRQLFLDTLLAAANRLHVSYVGRSVRDNSERAASVCVEELLDALDGAFSGVAQGDAAAVAASAFATVEHRLQGFSPAYFDGQDPKLFSYASENCKTGLAERDARHLALPFVTGPVDVEPPERITLHELTRFWLNPSRGYCTASLELTLPSDRDAPSDDEPMEMSGLNEYLARAAMVDHRVRGGMSPEMEAEVLPVLLDYPPGRLAAVHQGLLSERTDRFVDRLGPVSFLPPARLVFEGAFADGKPWVLSGELDGLTPAGLLRYRPGKLRAADRLRAWIAHLMLCACALPEGVDLPRQTTVVGEDATETLPPVPQAGERLRHLVELMRRGLAQPLRFFVQTSCNLADPACDTENKIWGAWKSSDYGFGESDDPYVRLCFRDRLEVAEIFGDEMNELAQAVWGPYFGCLAEGGSS